MDLTLPVDSIAIAAALCCALVAGLLFSFAVVVMPGFRRLGDREFLSAFRAVDGVIQGGQPVFLAVWAGSAVLPVLAVALRLVSGRALATMLSSVSWQPGHPARRGRTHR